MLTKNWWGDSPLTQAFGEWPEHYAQWGLPGHNGADFGCGVGTEIVAHRTLRVVEVGDDPTGFGYYVKCRDASGGEWLFAHLQSEDRATMGAVLEPGWIVGFSGSSGASTGPHLHVGYRPDWQYRAGRWNGWADPLPALPREWDQPL